MNTVVNPHAEVLRELEEWLIATENECPNNDAYDDGYVHAIMNTKETIDKLKTKHGIKEQPND